MNKTLLKNNEQKEDKEELVYRLNGLMQNYIKEGKNDEEKEHRLKCYHLFWNALEDTSFFEQIEEQIATLWDAISNLKHDGYKHVEELISLYEQLKDLL